MVDNIWQNLAALHLYSQAGDVDLSLLANVVNTLDTRHASFQHIRDCRKAGCNVADREKIKGLLDTYLAPMESACSKLGNQLQHTHNSYVVKMRLDKPF